MKVIEVFTQAKNGNETLNEDGYFISKDYIAVIDGVTSKTTSECWKNPPGIEAKNTIVQAMKDADPLFTAEEHYIFLNEALCKKYSDITYFVKNPLDRLQVNCIVYSQYRKEIWFFGDCHCLVDGESFSNEKKIDTLLGELRSFVFQATASINQNSTEDIGREKILPFLKLQSNLANSSAEYGYLVLDGIGNMVSKIKKMDVSDANEIVLATDGYPILQNTLENTEGSLSQLRKSDPLLINKVKSTKGFLAGNESFDDRTYVKFNMNCDSME